MDNLIIIGTVGFYITLAAVLLMFFATIFFVVKFLKTLQKLKKAEKRLKTVRAKLSLANQKLYKYEFTVPEIDK